MRIPLVVTVALCLGLVSCDGKDQGSPSPVGRSIEEVTEDFCNTFNTANVYGDLPEDSDNSVAGFERSSDEFAALGETELAEVSQSFADLLRERSNHRELNVFLTDKATGDKLDALEQELLETDHVTSVEFISKQQAFDQLVDEFGEDSEVIEGVFPSDLPASFKVLMDDSAAFSRLERQMNHDKLVDQARSASFLDLVAPVGQALMSRVTGLCLAGFGGAPAPTP